MSRSKNTERQAEIVRAYVAARGRHAEAARRIGVSDAYVGQVLTTLHLLVPRDRDATLARAEKWLAEQTFSAVVSARSETPERPTVPARCHSDRQEFSVGLCRECYRERMERSRANPARPSEVDPDIKAQLQGLSRHVKASAEVPRSRGDKPIKKKPKMTRAEVRAVADSDSSKLSASQFQILEAFATGMTRESVFKLFDLRDAEVLDADVDDICKALGVDNLVGAFVKLGWLKIDYDATMTEAFIGMLERVDLSIHRAIAAASRSLPARR